VERSSGSNSGFPADAAAVFKRGDTRRINEQRGSVRTRDNYSFIYRQMLSIRGIELWSEHDRSVSRESAEPPKPRRARASEVRAYRPAHRDGE